MKRIAVLAIVLGVSPAHAAFVSFDAPGGGNHGGDGTYAYGVTSQGMVLGTVVGSNGTSTGYIRTPDGAITIFAAGDCKCADTHAIDINDGGTVVGYYMGTDAHFHGFTMTTPDGTITSFDPQRSSGTQAIAINAKGDVAGQFSKHRGTQRGFVRTARGKEFNFLVGPDSGFGAFVTAINNAKTVVGFWFDGASAMHGYMRTKDGTDTPIDADGAGTGAVQGTQAEGINTSGAVAGFYTDGANARHGFVRNAGGTITEFDAPNAVSTVVAGINKGGDIAGYYIDSSSVAHGFLRTAKGKFKSFDAPGASQTAGAGTFVSRIADDGTIVGETYDSSFIAHGFVGMP